MATRLLSRSKTLTLTLNRSFFNRSSESLRALHSLTSPVDLGVYNPSASRSAASRFVPRPGLPAASASPAVSSILGSKKILGYERTQDRWFSANAQGKPASHLPSTEKKTMEEVGKVVSGVVEHASHVEGKDVTCFSPLEAISVKPRSSSLDNESLKIKRSELSQKITFALIPALVLISKSSLTTSLLVLSVYWQIYGYFKEIFLDYVHQDVTRKWVFIYFQVLLLILIKDTFLDFGLV